jgi:hypothetical protein
MVGERISGLDVEELRGELPLRNPSKTDVTLSCLLTPLINQLKLFFDVANAIVVTKVYFFLYFSVSPLLPTHCGCSIMLL